MNYNNINYKMKNIFIILAAGLGRRFNNKLPKQYVKIGRYNSIETIINKLISSKKINLIVIVYNKKYIKQTKKIISNYKKHKIKLIEGGKVRQESSHNALKKLKKLNPKKVIIHDACRPNIDINEINKIFSILNKYDACAPVIKNIDLARIKRNDKMIEYKSDIYLTQTPQGFNYKKILLAHNQYKFIDSRDDIELMNTSNHKLKFINGNKNNIKITYKKDIEFFDSLNKCNVKYGIGYDIHPFNFKSKRKLKLCGVRINYYPLEGHSDADVGYHALCDSIFGALSIGDIGKIFNNKSPKWKNANSKIFLKHAKNKIQEFNATINNIDINFICEKPLISIYSKKMKSNISNILNIKNSQISIKATTNEKIGFIGKGKGIAAESIISLNL